MRNPMHPNAIAKALEGLETMDEWTLHVFGGPSVKLNPKTKNAVYWVGEDVYRTLHEASYRAEAPKADVHVTVHNRLTLDLKACGIEASTAYFFAPKRPIWTPCPESTNVAVYLPKYHPKFRVDEHLQIFEACPEILFTVYGCGEDVPSLPKNCVRVPWVSYDQAANIVAESSCLLRFTRHDGFPQNIIIAKQTGRNVVASFPYQGCKVARTVEHVVYELKKPTTHQTVEGEWVHWYARNCHPRSFRSRIARLLP